MARQCNSSECALSAQPENTKMQKKLLIISLSYVLFALSTLVALNFSYTQLSELVGKLTTLTQQIESEKKDFQFDCKDEECHRCAIGIMDNPNSIIFTGGSSFRYGVNMDVFSESVDLPLVNCIRNDTRVDAYTTFFNYLKINNPKQIVLHGYNSWAINSPGTWTQEKSDGFKSWFNVRETELQKKSNRSSQEVETPASNIYKIYKAYSTYLSIFQIRSSAELPNYWRIILAAKYNFYKNRDISYWPLTKEKHQKKKYKLMRQWIYKSPWARSFMIGMESTQPKEKIISRHDQFISAISPRRHIFMFPAPELTEIFPADIRGVLDSSRDIFLTHIRTRPEVTHVEIDYKACGITADDFWIDSVKIYDPAHPNSQAQTKISQCVIEYLAEKVNQVEKNRP